MKYIKTSQEKKFETFNTKCLRKIRTPVGQVRAKGQNHILTSELVMGPIYSLKHETFVTTGWPTFVDVLTSKKLLLPFFI